MKTKILNKTDILFSILKNAWENELTNKLVSFFLVYIFLFSSIASFLVYNGYISLGHFDKVFSNPFFSIEIAFTLLLILELLSLIFVLHKSVAKSVGKQFELLSLIFLRSGFKEFSHIQHFNWEIMSDSVLQMFADGFGALTIFIIFGFTEKLRKHTRLTDTEDDQKEFIQAKKLLSILLLIAFLIVGIIDIKIFFQTSEYLHSFHTPLSSS